MGVFGDLFRKLFGGKKVDLLVIGLDNSGKSTIVNSMKPKGAKDVVPTVGYQVEEFSKNGIRFKCVDMSGQSKYRALWENYYDETTAIIWVVDSADLFRMVVCKDELETMLEHKAIAANPNIPVLFLANKMDVAGALSPEDVVKRIELEQLLKGREWHISQTNALTGDGVEEGMKWLVQAIEKNI